MARHTAAILVFTLLALAWGGSFLLILSGAEDGDQAWEKLSAIPGVIRHALAAALSALTAWLAWNHGEKEAPWLQPALIAAGALISLLAWPTVFALPPAFFLAWLGLRDLLDRMRTAFASAASGRQAEEIH